MGTGGTGGAQVGGEADTYVIEGPGFVDQQANQVSDYVLVVTDEDGNNPDYSIMGGNMVRVRFTRHDAVPSIDEAGNIAAGCLPDNARLTDVGLQGILTASLQSTSAATLCSINLDLANVDRFSIHATTVPSNTRLGLSLTVISDDGSTSLVDTHTVTFLNPGMPAPAPAPVLVPAFGRGDLYSVVSYNDWAYTDVTDGYIVTDVNGVAQLVNVMPHEILGWMDRDEPVVDTYRLGLDARENLTQRANPEMGQHTVEVLVTASDVQLTVTSNEEGPAYIRFLDSDMQPFGTDVDEEIEYRGADVVGLDSQGRLEMTENGEPVRRQGPGLRPVLVYRARRCHRERLPRRPGRRLLPGHLPVLRPLPGQRARPPLLRRGVREDRQVPADPRDDHLYPASGSQSLQVVGDHVRRPRGRRHPAWTEAIGAVAHHVIAIDTRTFTVVQDSYQRVAAPVYSAEITGLEPAVEYIFAVAAERVDGSGIVSYSDPTSDDSYISQFMNWSRP